MSERRAVVVGAGIAGLASAIALAQAGWRVALLERGERLRGDNTGMLIWPNGVRALRSLGLGVALDAISEPVQSAGVRIPDGRFVLRGTSEQVAERLGLPTVAVHRGQLFELLVSALGDRVEVHTGVTVTHIDLVDPAAGDHTRRWSAHLLIGADGVGSAVRSAIDGTSRVTSMGVVAFQAVIPPHRVPRDAEGDRGGETHGEAGRRFVYAPIGSAGMYWTAMVRGGLRPESPEIQHELLNRWFANWHEPIPSLISSTRPAELSQEAITYLRPLPRHYVQAGEMLGACLVGDAAHAMPPDLAQGGGLALEDAVTLGVCMRHGHIPEALREYEKLRQGRTVKLARMSRRAATIFGAHGRLTRPLRDSALRALPTSWYTRGPVDMADWNPPQAD